MCHTGGEAYKSRLVHRVASIIMALNNFVPLFFKTFIVNVLKCKACVKQILNACAHVIMDSFKLDDESILT